MNIIANGIEIHFLSESSLKSSLSKTILKNRDDLTEAKKKYPQHLSTGAADFERFLQIRSWSPSFLQTLLS